ncbi:MAG: hypothetical protein HN534_06225 [Euryarchaeota archaeon]|jgi:hypothetical protein|nr:hypothetical protein [Euryarchaeota archaeon]MBT3654507.1 hypothetical protein [Euryarchaeota archaeon]MBT3757678.1 hypothetical protein [Euryarchaeota archaeon]MBT4050526.1 hypothetical protein [Euryarchaeota archaeon]MBT4346176.1 hypothetical protein [Euryarchaeota archaeon]|tara:strand:- start:10622 stop:11560 length:939 start_codon:yes stop_codon:yes gene_type:complete
MEETVRALFASRGDILNQEKMNWVPFEFVCLGSISALPEVVFSDNNKIFVWYIPKGILPIDVNEIERWLVDVPQGNHWFLSERNLTSQSKLLLSKYDNIQFWDSPLFSSWIGKAVLNGDIESIITTKTDTQTTHNYSHSFLNQDVETIFLRPIVDLDSWLDNRGWATVNTIPIVLECKLWSIFGSLVGPSGETEPNNWQIIEDPWSKSTGEFSKDEVLEIYPNLRALKSSNPWFTNEKLLENLKPLLDKRRIQKGSEPSPKVKSMLLEWWRADLDTISMSSNILLIPGWNLQFEGGAEQVLHGRNGKLYELN